jgi:glycine/D-amino acid oxidase-like deaminating enzyme
MQENAAQMTTRAKQIAEQFEDGSVPIDWSGWLPAGPLPTLPSLRDDVETDVVVVGAGLAGASTFLHLTERGASAVLVESGQPANGASGRNAGHFVPHLDDVDTFKSWPGRKGDKFFQYAFENRNIVYDIAATYGLDADCHQVGGVVASRRPVKKFTNDVRFWRDVGYAIEEVRSDELLLKLGTDRYKHGVYWAEAGRMNPYLFTNGLVAAARGHGGLAFGDSPVQSCAYDSGRWRVSTLQGSVVARKIAICTNGNQGNDFFPEIQRAGYPLVANVLATRPLPPELTKMLVPSGVVVEQHPGLYHLVLDGRNRLISSTIPSVGSAHDAKRYRAIFLRWLNKAFPVTRDFDIELESYWSGIMYSGSATYGRGYPCCFDLGAGAYALVNLGSWGNFMGPLLGKSLGHALADDRPDDFVMPMTTPKAARWPGQFDFTIRRLGVPALRLAERLGLA